MKSRYFSVGAIAALVVFSPGITRAQDFDHPTASKGILLMGFRAVSGVGSGTNVVVNIGQASTYRDGSASAAITNLNNELATNFGADWAARTDIQWGIGGCPTTAPETFNGDTTDTLYMSREQTVAGTPNSLPTINTKPGRARIASNFRDVLGLETTGAGFDDSRRSSFNPLIGIQDEADFNHWGAFLGPGGVPGKAGTTGETDFDWDTTGIETSPSKTLSLLRFGGAPTGQVTASYLGYFKIEANGDVSFNKASSAVSYTAWATANAGGQAASGDFDNDGIPNGVEWFMGANAANPQLASGTITWPRAAGNAAASSVIVQTSTDLVTWTNALTGLQSVSGPVSYTLPAGETKRFVRLSVTP